MPARGIKIWGHKKRKNPYAGRKCLRAMCEHMLLLCVPLAVVVNTCSQHHQSFALDQRCKLRRSQTESQREKV